ncbi:MAG: hypothetical protein NZ772_14515 [Cyanobacteria bacterium]|nr:hypothetical protein [Cyanobacteriota bacterium]MDW8202581.1 hypothetical protein [Cyanobacteriota bacterium SKYGB_h_bin112]
MVIQGQLRYLDQGIYPVVFAPIAQLKHFFQACYNRLLVLVWPELASRNPIIGTIHWPIVLLSFLGVSLLAYYLKDFSYLLVPGVSGLWFADRWWARQQYLNASTIASTTLDINPAGDLVTWQLTQPNKPPQRQQFKPGDIAQLSILNVPLVGGAFADVVLLLWQVRLILRQGTALRLYEETTAHEALALASRLANEFGVPTKFAFSEGTNPYAAQIIPLEVLIRHAQTVKTVQAKKTDYKWQVTYQWDGSRIGLLIGLMLQRGGFPLFLLLMMGILFRIGGMMAMIIPILPGAEDAAFSNMIRVLLPSLGWWDMLSIFAGMAIIFRQGALLTNPTQLNFGRNSLIVPISQAQTVSFSIEDIKATLFVKKPFPKLMIVAKQQSVELEHLQTEKDFRALLGYIDQRLQPFTAKQREIASDDL